MKLSKVLPHRRFVCEARRQEVHFPERCTRNGRGEAIRLALTYGGIPFEDRRIDKQAEWNNQTKRSYARARLICLRKSETEMEN